MAVRRVKLTNFLRSDVFRKVKTGWKSETPAHTPTVVHILFYCITFYIADILHILYTRHTPNSFTFWLHTLNILFYRQKIRVVWWMDSHYKRIVWLWKMRCKPGTSDDGDFTLMFFRIFVFTTSFSFFGLHRTRLIFFFFKSPWNGYQNKRKRS